MLPLALPHAYGSTAKTLTAAQKNQACTFSLPYPATPAVRAVLAGEGVAAVAAVAAIPAGITQYRISRVTINVRDMYLQVRFF